MLCRVALETQGLQNQGLQKLQGITKRDRATEETISEGRINFNFT